MQAKYVAFPVPSLTLCYCMGFNNATCIIQESCCCLGYHYVMNFGGREEELNFLEKRHNYSLIFVINPLDLTNIKKMAEDWVKGICLP